MGLMSGKNVVIFGIANKRSIAWGIAQALHREGAQLALNYQNDRMEEPVRKLAADLPGDTFLAPCDVTVPGDIDRFFGRLGKEFGPLDGLVHSIAFAKREELGGNFVDTSWEGYQMAQQVSAWSLIGLAKGAAPLMEGRDAGIVCLSYYGAEKVVPNYNVMGVAKAALEASTRYLANDMGPKGVRVNAISAGPIKTVSSVRCSTRWRRSRRSGATSTRWTSATPRCSSSRVSRAASRARRSTSTPATASWVREPVGGSVS